MEVIRARRTGAVLRVMMLIRKFVSFKRESSEARKTDFCPPEPKYHIKLPPSSERFVH